MIKFLQTNLRVNRTAQDLMIRTAQEIGAKIIIVSEQNRNGEEDEGWFPDSTGHAAIFVKGNIPV